jgi:hypothetical protein
MLYKATGDQKYLDIMNEFFWNVTDTILDEDEYLYYRDPSYIGQVSPNGKKVLWSRGNGWVFAAFPRILKYMPKDDLNYGRFVSLYRSMASSLAGRQHDDGLWRSNLDDSDHYSMPESSGTAFFTYGLAWGINQGLLDPAVYGPVIEAAWEGLVTIAVHPDGKLGWVQPVGGQPSSSTYETTHEYAVGGFLLAGGEMYKYYHAQNRKITVDDPGYQWLNEVGEKTVDITATVTDLDGIGGHIYRWSSPDGATFAADTYVETATGATLSAKVKFTAAGDYILNVQVDDNGTIDVDTVTVHVYANSCAADKAQTSYSETDARLLGDTNYDCKVDLVDFAAMAENWLIDVSLSL